MVDASGLINALGRDDLNQRAVADHLVLLAKVRNSLHGGEVKIRKYDVLVCT